MSSIRDLVVRLTALAVPESGITPEDIKLLESKLLPPQNKATRYEVYQAIDGEREYQQGWDDPDLTTSGGRHNPLEFLTYIQTYVNEAIVFASKRPDPEAIEQNLHALRKIAALAVSAMEQNGVRYRDPKDNLRQRHTG